MDAPLTTVNPRSTSQPYDRGFGIIAYGALVLTLLFFTYLHHFEPQILSVPSNKNISLWRNPSFPETVIHDQVPETEKKRLGTEGVVLGDNLPAQFLTDLFTVLLSLLCFVHALRHYGFWMASCFLIGSFAFTGMEESLWILSGRFFGGTVLNPLGETFYGTYWFTRGGLWFIETPVVACFGWFFIAYSCVLTAGKVSPRMNMWGRAAVGGLIAMGIDLWQDPVQTAPEIMSWVWAKGDFFLLFGIPHYNFLGWFLLIFLFAIFWEKLPRMEEKCGRARATTLFFLIILVVPFLVFVFIWLWLFLFGNLLSFMGAERAIHIPSGW